MIKINYLYEVIKVMKRYIRSSNSIENLTDEFVSQFTEDEFISYLRDNKIKFNKKYDDIHVGGQIFQFGRDGHLL